jgi:hypothetical protein
MADAVPAIAGTQRGSAAVCGRAAVWQRQPAGVLCVERVEVHVAPFLVELEQDYAVLLLDVVPLYIRPLGLAKSIQQR